MPKRLVLIEGEACTKTFTIMQDGQAFDLTGYTVTFQAQDMNPTKGTPLFSITATVTSAANGVCTVAFTTTQTAMPTAGDDLKGRCRFYLTDGTNKRWTKVREFLLERNDFYTP